MKSELNSTDIYSNKSNNDSDITLKIGSTDPKWASLFYNPQPSDFKIRHRNLYHAVHRNVIFKNISLHVLDMDCEEGCLSLPDHFNPQLVQGVISCLYSLELKICRSQALQALDIIHCLHICKLQRLLQQDIKNNIEQYELFSLLEKSILIDMGDIQQMCLNQLELQSYEQMRYEKFQLLNCKQQTFKWVIHHHNERHWEDPAFGLADKFIQDIIQEYSKHNNYSQRDRLKLIKSINQMSVIEDFPTFTKVKLTPLKINDSQIEPKLYTPRSVIKESLAPKIKSLSPLAQHCSSTKSMIVDLTYMGQRKRKGSGGPSNSQTKMASDYIVIKEQNREMLEQAEKMRYCLQKMTKTLKQKEGECRNNKFKLGQIESILQECQKQLMEENKSLMLLDVRLDKVTMKKISETKDDSIESSDSSDQQDKVTSPKTKDQNLRVSLAESRWMVC